MVYKGLRFAGMTMEGSDSMDLRKLHDIFEWPVLIFFFTGVVTAILNLTLGGFTPLIWFLMSLFFLVMIICFETTMIREHLEKKNKPALSESNNRNRYW
jgi:hypothetical protein